MLIHQAGAEIGIGSRSGITDIDPERPRTITIIPITTETGATTRIQIGMIRPMAGCGTAEHLSNEPAFIGALDIGQPAGTIAGNPTGLAEGVSRPGIAEFLEGRLDVIGGIAVKAVNPLAQIW